MRREKKEKLSKSAASGMVALVFLVLGFQLAIFVVKVIERPRCPVKPGMTSGLDVTSEPGMTDIDERQSSAASETTGRSKYGGY